MTEPSSGTAQPNVLRDAAQPNVLLDAGRELVGGPPMAGSPRSGGRGAAGVFVGVLVSVAVAAAIGWASNEAGLPDDACLAVDVLIAEDVPGTVTREPRDWMPARVLPGYAISWDGPMTFEQVVASRVNPDEVRVELTKDRYVDGYEQEWEGSLDVGFAAYRFVTTEGAQAFHAFGNRFACQFANEAFRGPRGSIGLQVRYASGQIGEQVSWVSANTRVVVISFHDEAPTDHSVIEALIAQVP